MSYSLYLAEYALNVSRLYYGMTPRGLRQLAFKFCVANKIEEPALCRTVLLQLKNRYAAVCAPPPEAIYNMDETGVTTMRRRKRGETDREDDIRGTRRIGDRRMRS